jgi:hypothetical protein
VIEIVSDSREDVLILPEYAVVMQNGCSGVYCLNEQGVKTWKPTELGLRANGMAEIVAGLSEGEYVVID